MPVNLVATQDTGCVDVVAAALVELVHVDVRKVVGNETVVVGGAGVLTGVFIDDLTAVDGKELIWLDTPLDNGGIRKVDGNMAVELAAGVDTAIDLTVLGALMTAGSLEDVVTIDVVLLLVETDSVKVPVSDEIDRVPLPVEVVDVVEDDTVGGITIIVVDVLRNGCGRTDFEVRYEDVVNTDPIDSEDNAIRLVYENELLYVL